MEATTKITISTISLIIGEVLFWLGGIMVGKELFSKYKTYLNPKNWLKKQIKTRNQNDILMTAVKTLFPPF